MDADSFKRLFLPLHPKLFRIAYALVESKADAEDILQDAYCKLWNRRDELAGIQSPEAFCVTLVKNLCLDFLRSAHANRHDEEITEAITLSTDSSPEKELETQDTASTTVNKQTATKSTAGFKTKRNKRLLSG